MESKADWVELSDEEGSNLNAWLHQYTYGTKIKKREFDNFFIYVIPTEKEEIFWKPVPHYCYDTRSCFDLILYIRQSFGFNLHDCAELSDDLRFKEVFPPVYKKRYFCVELQPRASENTYMQEHESFTMASALCIRQALLGEGMASKELLCE